MLIKGGLGFVCHVTKAGQKIAPHIRNVGSSLRLITAAQKIVCRHTVIVADLAYKSKPRLSGAVFVVAQQSLTDIQLCRRSTLADIALPAKSRSL